VDNIVRVDTILLHEAFAQLRPSLGRLPHLKIISQALACNRHAIEIQQSQSAQMQHNLRHAAGKKETHGWVICRPVWQHVDQSRHCQVNSVPVSYSWTSQYCSMGYGWNMQQQICGATACGVNCHRVVYRSTRNNMPHRDPGRIHFSKRPGRLPRHIEPDWLPGWRQCRVRQRHSERLAHYLSCGSRAKKLTAAPRRCASAASQLSRLFQSDFAVGKSGAYALYLPCIFTFRCRKRDTPRYKYARQVVHGSERHHHCGQAFVARGNTEYPPAIRE
jgi:hypothetical protein